ncbi:MAG: hypothetical protein ABI221_00020 [Candidatus Saccharimonadales bacterium]
MSAAEKDTIYIDVDDEITNIIDKVGSSKHKIVALVLPKRATVLQSIVNMKLLRRSTDNAKKQLVLITSEAGLLPLAGAVGIHVAKNLQSKPAIPSGPDTSDVPESLIDEEEVDNDEDPELDDSMPVGELAGQPAAVAAAAAMPAVEEEAIDLDNDHDEDQSAATSKSKKKAKTPKDKKLKVPNFDRFRKWLIFGGLALIILLIGGWLAIFKLPKATIAIDTDSSQLNATFTFTADTTTHDFDAANSVVPAELSKTSKTATQNAPATGQQNNGNKASGSVTMTAKACGSDPVPPNVSSGTGVSVNGQTYITQQNVSFSWSHNGPGVLCSTFTGGSTSITAQGSGVAYNTGGSTNFTVAGRSDVSASGSASGGTDNIQTVVSQADIDGAKAKLAAPNTDDIKKQLSDQIKKDGMTPVDSSFKGQDPAITASTTAGSAANDVTVTSVTNYTMLGINQANLKSFIDGQIKQQINTQQQAILNDGLNKASFTVQADGDNPKVSVQTTAIIGPNLDTDAIKKAIAGKKKGDATDIIENRPSIKGVTIKYSPFWVTKTPSQTSKIVITFDKAND